jgi:8-oxo-dGTP pyrophosphatase MutT (NUDIX family)
MNSDWIIDRFQDRHGRSTGRGDHDLNPGMPPPEELTPAAVLIPMVAREGGMTMLLTQRTNNLAHHPGQVSFPGGHVEDNDSTPEETALRETEEEVGIDRRHIHIIGKLANYWTRTGFTVTPVVGIVTPPFDILPDPSEVAEVFEVPLDFLMDSTNHERQSREYKGAVRQFYAMPYNGYYIWGATAGMLVDLHDVLVGE